MAEADITLQATLELDSTQATKALENAGKKLQQNLKNAGTVAGNAANQAMLRSASEISGRLSEASNRFASVIGKGLFAATGAGLVSFRAFLKSGTDDAMTFKARLDDLGSAQAEIGRKLSTEVKLFGGKPAYDWIGILADRLRTLDTSKLQEIVDYGKAAALVWGTFKVVGAGAGLVKSGTDIARSISQLAAKTKTGTAIGAATNVADDVLGAGAGIGVDAGIVVGAGIGVGVEALAAASKLRVPALRPLPSSLPTTSTAEVLRRVVGFHYAAMLGLGDVGIGDVSRYGPWGSAAKAANFMERSGTPFYRYNLVDARDSHTFAMRRIAANYARRASRFSGLEPMAARVAALRLPLSNIYGDVARMLGPEALASLGMTAAGLSYDWSGKRIGVDDLASASGPLLSQTWANQISALRANPLGYIGRAGSVYADPLGTAKLALRAAINSYRGFTSETPFAVPRTGGNADLLRAAFTGRSALGRSLTDYGNAGALRGTGGALSLFENANRMSTAQALAGSVAAKIADVRAAQLADKGKTPNQALAQYLDDLLKAYTSLSQDIASGYARIREIGNAATALKEARAAFDISIGDIDYSRARGAVMHQRRLRDIDRRAWDLQTANRSQANMGIGTLNLGVGADQVQRVVAAAMNDAAGNAVRYAKESADLQRDLLDLSETRADEELRWKEQLVTWHNEEIGLRNGLAKDVNEIKRVIAGENNGTPLP